MNKTFKLNWEEKAVFDVFMFAAERHLDPKEVSHILFTGDNYTECEEFLEGNYDNTVNYPNIIEQGVVKRVKEGDVIVKYKNEVRVL